MSTTPVKRQPKPLQADVEDDDAVYNTRTPSSVRRYHSKPPVHADTLDDLNDEPFIQQRRASRQIQTAPQQNTHATHTTAPQAIEVSKTTALSQPRRFPMVPVMVG